MLPAKRFPANTFSSELSLTRMPTWLRATRLSSTRLPWPLSMKSPSVLPAISLSAIERVLDRLQQQAVGPMAAVGDEPVARQRQALREHQRRAGGVVSEDVPLEPVAIGIHVVQPVAHVLDVVVAHVGAVDEREVDAVARIADDVAGDDVAGRVPDVDAVAAPVLVERDGAQLAFAGLQAIPSADRPASSVSRAPDDRVALDPGAIGVADVDAMQALGDAVAADGRRVRP